MLHYFKVEFFTGVAGIGPFVHVASRTADVAAILAQAERIAQGSADLGIEHIWEVLGTSETQLAEPFLKAGRECVIPNAVFEQSRHAVRAGGGADLGAAGSPLIRKDKNGRPIDNEDQSYSPEVLKAMKEPPLEMKLCEAGRVFLQPNLAYVFTVDRSCRACLEAEARATPHK